MPGTVGLAVGNTATNRMVKIEFSQTCETVRSRTLIETTNTRLSTLKDVIAATKAAAVLAQPKSENATTILGRGGWSRCRSPVCANRLQSKCFINLV